MSYCTFWTQFSKLLKTNHKELSSKRKVTTIHIQLITMQQKIHMPTTSMIPTHSFGYGTFVDNTTEKNQAIWEMHNSLETVYLLKLNPDNSTTLLSIFPNKHVTTGSNKVQQERKKRDPKFKSAATLYLWGLCGVDFQ